MKNKTGKILMAIGLLLMLAALFITIYNVIDERRAEKTANEALDQLITETELQREENEAYKSDYLLNSKIEMPKVTIDEEGYIGILDIPSIEISLPIMATWSYPKLRKAPCRYTGSAYENNLVIAAHNYTTHFGKLPNLSYGDRVTFTDIDGNQFCYEVSEIETLKPTDIKKMVNSDYELTLFTCTIGGKARFTVRCSLVETL